jgi:hypothetical protein
MPFLLGITLDPHCESILNILPGPLRNHSWWAKKPDLYTMLDKFRNSQATDPRDQIYALLNISSDTCDTDLLKVDYNKELEDVIFDTISFLLDFNKLDSPPCRLFNWGFSEFLENSNSLANEVLKWAIYKEHVALVKLIIVRDDVDINIKAGNQALRSWAEEEGYTAIAKMLFGNIIVNSQDNYFGLMPLLWAAGEEHEEMVKLLLTKDEVDVNSRDNYYGRTPLSWAAWKGHCLQEIRSTRILRMIMEGRHYH